MLSNRYRNDNNGRPAYHPELLLRIKLMSYSRGMYSSRQMARACIREYPFSQETGLLHSSYKEKGKCAMDPVLHGPQYREICQVCELSGLMGSSE